MFKCFNRIMEHRLPLIVILGGTGTGKSKLGIEIAKQLNTEIISADSMQVYRGLDILTNKVTLEERAQVPHHLIDFLSPLNKCTVLDFRNLSLPIIDRLFESGKPPLIVGGTNYYIESIVWRILVDNDESLQYDNMEFQCENDRDMSTISEVLIKLGENIVHEKETEETLTYKDINFINLLEELTQFNKQCFDVLVYLKDLIIKENELTEYELFIDKFYDIINSPIRIVDVETSLNLLKVKMCSNCNKSINKKYFSYILKFLELKFNIIELSNKLTNQCTSKLKICCVNYFNEYSNELTDEFNSIKLKSNQFDDIISSLLNNLKKLDYFIDNCLLFDEDFVNGFKERNIESIKSCEFYEMLKKVDPERVKCLHPNDRRKILRSLEIWSTRGTKHSEILIQQRQTGSSLGGPLRFKNTIIFWLKADKDVLNKRLDERVDQMIENGLVEELVHFYNEYKPQPETFTKGIFQSIGFKEFREFLFLDHADKFNEIGKKKLEEGIETLKRVTRRYVKQQNKWIMNRFFNSPDREVPPIYSLDTSDIERWNELVLEPALDVIYSTIEGRESKINPLSFDKTRSVNEVVSLKTGNYFCETCDRPFVGLLQWSEHLKSKKHKKMVYKKRSNPETGSDQEKTEIESDKRKKIKLNSGCKGEG